MCRLCWCGVGDVRVDDVGGGVGGVGGVGFGVGRFASGVSVSLVGLGIVGVVGVGVGVGVCVSFAGVE